MTSIKIAPSILAADFARLGEEVALVEHDADLLHVDVMDGHFVPVVSIGGPVVRSLRKATNLFLDCHLMCSKPEVLFDEFAEAGADRIIFHIELGDPRPNIERLRDLGIGVGIVMNPPTPVAEVFPYLDAVDMVLVMSVNPGWGGQPFIPEALEKVSALRDEIQARGLQCPIEIDGGIKQENAAVAAAAGADILVAGSAVFGAADPAAAVQAIRHAATSAQRSDA